MVTSTVTVLRRVAVLHRVDDQRVAAVGRNVWPGTLREDGATNSHVGICQRTCHRAYNWAGVSIPQAKQRRGIGDCSAMHANSAMQDHYPTCFNVLFDL